MATGNVGAAGRQSWREMVWPGEELQTLVVLGEVPPPSCVCSLVIPYLLGRGQVV